MIICICGPTGVGKTKLSIELAKKYNAIVLNCDAMQVYKGMDIGTAKIKEEEKENVKHYLFDIRNVDEDYSVYNYQKDVRKILNENKDKNVIIVGGTGLYMKAALYDYRFSDEEVSDDRYNNLTNEELYNLCLNKDKNMDIHVNNRKRLIRFLNKKETINNKDELLYDAKFIGLTTSREILYERINNRVDEMISEGLIKEVKHFYDQKIYSKALMTAIGYKELYEYFDKRISLDEAIDLIKQRSRKYAKRQYTWYNNQMSIEWFEVDFNNFNNTIDKVINYLEEQ